MTNKSPMNEKGGPSIVLTEDEGNQLVSSIFYFSNHGYPVKKSQSIKSVVKLAKIINHKIRFLDGRPGRLWYEAFLNRLPEIAKKAQNLSYSRAFLTEHAVRIWFDENEVYLKKKILKILDQKGLLIVINRYFC